MSRGIPLFAGCLCTNLRSAVIPRGLRPGRRPPARPLARGGPATAQAASKARRTPAADPRGDPRATWAPWVRRAPWALAPWVPWLPWLPWVPWVPSGPWHQHRGSSLAAPALAKASPWPGWTAVLAPAPEPEPGQPFHSSPHRRTTALRPAHVFAWTLSSRLQPAHLPEAQGPEGFPQLPAVSLVPALKHPKRRSVAPSAPSPSPSAPSAPSLPPLAPLPPSARWARWVSGPLNLPRSLGASS